MYTFWYANMPDVTASYGRFSKSIEFFRSFDILQHVRSFIASSNFYKLCVKAEMKRWKVNLCTFMVTSVWVFFFEFSHRIEAFSCLKYCIYIKPLQIVCLMSSILVFRHARCYYRLHKVQKKISPACRSFSFSYN